MYASELIGKKAIRTKPVVLGEERDLFSNVKVITNYSYSFTSDPVLIVGTTESHILYKWLDKFLDCNKICILDCRYNDDNWTDYDELMKLANEENIKLMQQIAGQ